MDPFAQLGLAPGFDLDLRRVRSAWLRQAAQAHPDAKGTIDSASAANEAFRVLGDPIERAQALLSRLGHGAAMKDDAVRRALPDGFLLEMMEYRERADALDPGDRSVREALLLEARTQRGEAIARISGCFARMTFEAEPTPQGREEAVSILREINVVRSYDRMIEQLERENRGSTADPSEGSAS